MIHFSRIKVTLFVTTILLTTTVFFIIGYFPLQKLNAKKTIIISTDLSMGIIDGRISGENEIDDGLAVLSLIVSNKVEVLGLGIVFGNDSVDKEYKAAKQLLDLIGKEEKTPILTGSNDNMALGKNKCNNKAVKFMETSLAHSNKNITILGIGPLTDIACLITQDSKEMNKVQEIIVLIGQYPGEKLILPPGVEVTDFNFKSDIEAARVVLGQQHTKVVIIPFSLSSSILVKKNYVQSIKPKNSAGIFIHNITYSWISQWGKHFTIDGFYPWDMHAALYAIDSKNYFCEKMGYKIGYDGIENVTRGTVKQSGYGISRHLFLSKQYETNSNILVCTQTSYRGKIAFDKYLEEIYRDGAIRAMALANPLNIR